MEKQKNRNQHFVPRCYLKNFTCNGMVCILDIQKITSGIRHYVKRVSTKSICSLKDYYTIFPNKNNTAFKLNLDNDLFVENEVLTRLEQRFGSLYTNVVTQSNITMVDAIDMADFIIQLKLRNPFWFEKQDKMKHKMIDSIIDKIVKEQLNLNLKFKDIPFEIIKRVANLVKDENKNNPNFSKMMQLYSLIERFSDSHRMNRNIRQAIIDCQWHLFIAPENGPQFITSDNPGFATDKSNQVYDTKFKDDFVFFFPLSPAYCLVISDASMDTSYSESKHDKEIQRIDVDASTVLNINNQAIQLINKLLIASDETYLTEIAIVNSKEVNI